MATFYFKSENMIHLDFCSKVKIDLEYSQETIEKASKIQKILTKLHSQLETESFNNKKVELILFGCLTTIIGKENAIKVKKLRNPCTMFDLVDILTYIASEIADFANGRGKKEDNQELTGDEFDIDKYMND